MKENKGTAARGLLEPLRGKDGCARLLRSTYGHTRFATLFVVAVVVDTG